MNLYSTIVPSGIAATILFVWAAINGIQRFKLFKHHAFSGYACLVLVIYHSTAAIMCNIWEPLGVLASLFMILTVASGYFRWKISVHITIAILTLAAITTHVALVIALKG